LAEELNACLQARLQARLQCLPQNTLFQVRKANAPSYLAHLPISNRTPFTALKLIFAATMGSDMLLGDTILLEALNLAVGGDKVGTFKGSLPALASINVIC
jgi:hypothetical protein